jgi:hypothetical protein
MKSPGILKIMIVLLAVMGFSTDVDAALSKGNTTTDNTTPSNDYVEYAHDHNGTGDSHVLVCMVTINNNNSWSGWPTYNGAAPDYTSINTSMGGSLNSKILIMAWSNPPTGSNTLRINFTANEHNAIVSICQSYSEAAIGNIGTNAQVQNIHSRTLSMTTGSMVFVGGVISTGSAADITVDGTVYTSYDVDLSTGSRTVTFVTSDAIVSGGTITMVTDPNSGGAYMSNHRMEILESLDAAGANRRVINVN